MSNYEFFLPCFCVRGRESEWEANNVSSHGLKEKSHIDSYRPSPHFKGCNQ